MAGNNGFLSVNLFTFHTRGGCLSNFTVLGTVRTLKSFAVETVEWFWLFISVIVAIHRDCERYILQMPKPYVVTWAKPHTHAQDTQKKKKNSPYHYTNINFIADVRGTKKKNDDMNAQCWENENVCWMRSRQLGIHDSWEMPKKYSAADANVGTEESRLHAPPPSPSPPPSHPFLLSCSHAVVLRISTNALTRADKILFIFWGARAKLGENDEQWRKRQLAAYRLICINIVNIDVSVYGCTMGMTANPNPKRDIATFGTTQCVALFDSVYFMCILFARFRGAFHWKLTIEWDFALRMS